MNIEKIKALIKRKPAFFIVTAVSYLILTALLRWSIQPSLFTLLYILGGILGIFFLDIAEVFFDLNPSPFRSVLFFVLFIIVSFFIVTSSGSPLATGLVLSLYLTLLLWQSGQWKITGDLSSWYVMIAAPVTRPMQQRILIVEWVIFFVLTFLFVR